MSKIFDLIQQEKQRQTNGLELIPSENYVSDEVLTALGSELTNKYSEGFPGARYYGGNQIIDEIEVYTQELANKIFNTKYAIVQPYSGSPANLAVDLALAEPGDEIWGMALDAGGHLTHGASVSMTGKLFKSVQYGLDNQGKIDYEAIEAKVNDGATPKIIWAGLTAYPYSIDWKKFRQIADQSGAYLVADISHIAGFVAAGILENPADYVDVITTTTHKTLRGPRGAMILVTERGFAKDPEISKKLEKVIFPGLQGGPHNNVIGAIAVALEEAATAEFRKYAEQTLKNAKVLANELGTDTENHLMVLDLSKDGFGLGYPAQVALEAANITVNKNTVPNEPVSPFYPSGIRIGTPAVTSRGMKEAEMVKIAGWIKRVLDIVKGHDIPQETSERKQFIEDFKIEIKNNSEIKIIAQEVEEFAKQFPLRKND